MTFYFHCFMCILCLKLNGCEDIPKETDEVEVIKLPDTFCRQRNRLLTSEKDDLFNLIEATLGEDIMLQCHYCNETDDGSPKNWFKLDPLNDTKETEVELGIESNMTLNRLRMDASHTLIISNVTQTDEGEYFCKGLDDTDLENKYNFFIDIVVPSDIPPEKGDFAAWGAYYGEHFVTINKILQHSTGPEVTYLNEKMHVELEVITEWDNQGPCEICGRPKGDGKKVRKGRCRFKITSNTNDTIPTSNYNEKVLLRATHLSCRSMTLYALVPDIVNRTMTIPEFLEIERCDGLCNPDAEGVYRGWKTTKKGGFKYRKTFVLAENAHLTLICPDSTLENRVVWKINGRTIKQGESVELPSTKMEPRVTVDSFNTLYLYGVTKAEAGNYTCYVDDVRMQQVRVFVVSKARILTQAFVRHMMYLAFVLSLTLSCYCAGLVITWTRRNKFKTYEDLHAPEHSKVPSDDEMRDFDDYKKPKAKKSEQTTNYDTPITTKAPESPQSAIGQQEIIVAQGRNVDVERAVSGGLRAKYNLDRKSWGGMVKPKHSDKGTNTYASPYSTDESSGRTAINKKLLTKKGYEKLYLESTASDTSLHPKHNSLNKSWSKMMIKLRDSKNKTSSYASPYTTDELSGPSGKSSKMRLPNKMGYEKLQMQKSRRKSKKWRKYKGYEQLELLRRIPNPDTSRSPSPRTQDESE